MTDRVSARNEVAQQWASRRRQEENSPPRPPSPAAATIVPSLCYVIGKAWQDTLANLSSALSLNPKAIQQQAPKRGTNNKVFPSVLQILKANALQEQVSQFHDNDLQVLPSGYDFDGAIRNMANSRSRAFLLLDLACIVPTLVQWSQGLDECVQFLYTVQLNADAKLLQLLQRSKVGLVCTNKWDLQKCREISCEAPIYDNCTQTGKPDGYLRQLVLDAGVQTVAIDGAEEVHRITTALERMQKRRTKDDKEKKKKPNFILRLPSSNNNDQWVELVQSTKQAIAQHANCSLVGISVDVSNADPETFTRIQEILRLLHNPRLDLTGVSMPPTETMVQWWSSLSKEGLLSQITVDVSHALVSPAGALCARIIGVKEETISDDNDSSTTKLRRHYYIDDGCYGSLYHAKEHDAISDPLPLANDNNNNESATYYTSTVWGPTCDGLDRVCRDIFLPKLHRDQWLVFPNLGCRIGDGLGTDFNGFAPPDTVYCVLGYFGK